MLLGIELGGFLADIGSSYLFIGRRRVCDEEGVRFGATLLGSKALAGKWQPAWMDLTDENGVSLSEAMTEFGLDPSKAIDAKRTGNNQRISRSTHRARSLTRKAGITGWCGNRYRRCRRFEFIVKGKQGTRVLCQCFCEMMPCWEQFLYQAVEEATKRFDVLATVARFPVSREL